MSAGKKITLIGINTLWESECSLIFSNQKAVIKNRSLLFSVMSLTLLPALVMEASFLIVLFLS